MKKNPSWLLIGLLSFVLNACSQTQPKYMNISLNPKYNLDCISINQVQNKYSPADLYPAYVNCVKKNRYSDALALFIIADVYSFYDFARVSDRTSYKAIDMIKMNINPALASVTEEQKNNIRQMGINYKTPNSTEHSKFCVDIKRIGPPSYYPGYMIQNGMGFLMQNDLNPMVENFNSQAKWKELLGKYLHCSISD